MLEVTSSRVKNLTLGKHGTRFAQITHTDTSINKPQPFAITEEYF